MPVPPLQYQVADSAVEPTTEHAQCIGECRSGLVTPPLAVGQRGATPEHRQPSGLASAHDGVASA